MSDGRMGQAAGVQATASLYQQAGMGAGIFIGTMYHVECVREGQVIWTEDFHNIVTDVGLEHILRHVIAASDDNTGEWPALNNGAADGQVRGRGYPNGRRAPRRWVAATAVAVADTIQPAASASVINGLTFVCSTAGTTAANEPNWPGTFGAGSSGSTIADNTATWVRSGWFIGLKGNGASANTDRMGSTGAWSESTGYSDTIRRPFITQTLPATTTAAVQSLSNVGNLAQFNINASTDIYGAFMCDLPTKGGAFGTLYGVGNFTGGFRSVQSGDVLNVTVTCTVASTG